MTTRLLHAAIPLLTITTFMMLGSAEQAGAQVPRTISYQGLAQGDDGMPLPDGEHSFTFTLYPSATSKAIVYTQTTQATTKDGLFAVQIGPLPNTIPFNAPYWLGVAIDGSAEFEPRTELTSAAYSLHTGSADTALVAKAISAEATGFVRSVNGQSGNLTIEGNGGTTVAVNNGVIRISSDTATTTSGSGWELDGNTGTNPDEQFIGTRDEQRFEIHVAEESLAEHSGGGFGRVMLFEGGEQSPNIIGGHWKNETAIKMQGVTISGGGTFSNPNTTNSSYATVAGGKGNRANGENATVSGGSSNIASGQATTVSGGMFNKAESNSSTIGGGQRNTTKDWNSTVGGGIENTAESLASTVAGGQENAATGIGSTIGGGVSNRVFGNYGFVGGGEDNATSREFSTIAGGRFNNASAEGAVVAGGFSDTASGNYSAVVGGIANRATGIYSFTGGGEGNHTDGWAATIAGGSLNTAEGDFSAIAGGRGLTLKGDHSFGFLASPLSNGKKMTINESNVALLGNVDLWLANNDNKTRQIRFYAPNDEEGTFPGLNANYSSFQAGDQTTRIEYILPERMGSVGNFLSIASVDGSKVTLSWAGMVSDRKRKENFLPISGEDILSKFRSLELGSWSYRGEQHRHYGVMAQDFNAAFGNDALGTIGTDSTIQVSDLAGVAYLAIQALEKRTGELQETQKTLENTLEELKTARREEEELRVRLEKLERMMEEYSAKADRKDASAE